MYALLQLFNDLRPPHAELLPSAVTLVSALVVAIVAPLTFHLVARGGVKDFKQAVVEAGNQLPMTRLARIAKK